VFRVRGSAKQFFSNLGLAEEFVEGRRFGWNPHGFWSSAAPNY